MKLRTMLLASAAVMFAGSAMAADLTNPFYLPGQGEFTSDTVVDYSRTKMKHDMPTSEQTTVAEEIVYGVTDNFAVRGMIANEFDTQGEYNNDHNFDYELGAAYNMRGGNVLGQVAVNYMTWNPKDFYGHRNTDMRWQKYLNGELKLGYDMGDGLTPYASYSVTGNIDDDDRGLDQSAKVGVHKYAGDWAVDAGVRYDFNTDGKNGNWWYAEAEADYYLKENVALGVFGEYFLAGNGSDDVDYDYGAGAHVKVLF